MLNKGADFLKVNRVFFTDTTFEATRLHGRAMSRMRSYCDGKLMVIFITGQDLEEFNLPANVSEGIVQYAISVETAVAG